MAAFIGDPISFQTVNKLLELETYCIGRNLTWAKQFGLVMSKIKGKAFINKFLYHMYIRTILFLLTICLFFQGGILLDIYLKHKC